MPEGFTLWFTGLSGAGKTTIAEIVGPELERRGRLVEYLDGDAVRQHLSKGLGFSKEDRDTNIERVGWVASRLTRQGAAVLVSAISPYEETRQAAREPAYGLHPLSQPDLLCALDSRRRVGARACSPFGRAPLGHDRHPAVMAIGHVRRPAVALAKAQTPAVEATSGLLRG